MMDRDTNVKSFDRVLVLNQRAGTKTLDSTGLVDNQLFKGGNNLHVIMDLRTNLWYFRYDKGAVPPALKSQKFTRFGKALDFAKTYFEKRGIDITEVID